MDEQHLEEALRRLIDIDPDSLTDTLADVLATDDELHVMDDDVPAPAHISTFAEAGLLTNNSGLVVTFDNGAEFQLTIVRSR